MCGDLGVAVIERQLPEVRVVGRDSRSEQGGGELGLHFGDGGRVFRNEVPVPRRFVVPVGEGEVDGKRPANAGGSPPGACQETRAFRLGQTREVGPTQIVHPRSMTHLENVVCVWHVVTFEGQTQSGLDGVEQALVRSNEFFKTPGAEFRSEADEVAEGSSGKTVQQCGGCGVVSQRVLVGPQGLTSASDLTLQLFEAFLFLSFDPVPVRRWRRFERAVQDSG